MNRVKGGSMMAIEHDDRQLASANREVGVSPGGPLRPAAPDRSFRQGRAAESGGRIRVLIVDSCGLGAIGIGEILKSRWKEAAVSHARSELEIQTLLQPGRWDIVLVEIDLAEQSGLELVTRARAASPGLKMLAMSSGDESMQGLRALRAGSAGFLHRDGSAEDLLKAVEQVLAGRHYLSRRLADTLARRVHGQGQRPEGEETDQILSPREAQILEALAQGESIKYIGRRLDISPKTVSTYRSRILEKMHFRNDADIVKYWWAKGGVVLRP